MNVVSLSTLKSCNHVDIQLAFSYLRPHCSRILVSGSTLATNGIFFSITGNRKMPKATPFGLLRVTVADQGLGLYKEID